jgi:hypothetical protein
VRGISSALRSVTTRDDVVHPRAHDPLGHTHGFVGGAEVEFEQLLRSCCHELLRFDYDELTFMTSEGSPNHELICTVAHRMDRFAFHIELPEHPGTIERGPYVEASTSELERE